MPRLRKRRPQRNGWKNGHLESLTTRIKKMPVTRRTPPKGEKVYPIDLNLKNADLVEAVRVLADTMGLNYNIDPKVKGTVNVHASGKLSRSELLRSWRRSSPSTTLP